MHQFKVGDIVRVVGETLPIFDGILLGRVTKIGENGDVKIKVLDHKDREFVGWFADCNSRHLKLVARKRIKRNYDRLVAWSAILFFFLLLAVAIFVRTENVTRVQTPVSYEALTIRTGDTLWEIASERCPASMDKRDYIRTVQKKNGIGADIYPGDELLVPVYGGDSV